VTDIAYRRLGASGLTVSTIGIGCNNFGRHIDDARATEVVHTALDLGINLFDTADVYGEPEHNSEEVLGTALGSRRDEAVIATKFGTIRHTAGDERGLDGTPANIRRAVEGSLRRLRTDRIDLYYQHRMDPGTPIEDTVGALAELVAEGKIRGYGLSEASVATIRRAHAVHPVTAVQTEYSLWTRDPEAELLPALTELGIGFVPYSPLGRGFLTGTIRSLDVLDDDDFRKSNPRFADGAFQANLAIVDEVEQIARDAGATPAQVALAWLLAQGEHIAPIPGTRKLSRVEENIGAVDLVLTADQLAALGAVAAPVGERYADMSTVNR